VTFRRLAAVALIFVGTTAAWTVLGSSLVARNGVNAVPGAVITLNVQYRSAHVSWGAMFRAGTTSSTWESGHARRD